MAEGIVVIAPRLRQQDIVLENKPGDMIKIGTVNRDAGKTVLVVLAKELLHLYGFRQGEDHGARRHGRLDIGVLQQQQVLQHAGFVFR